MERKHKYISATSSIVLFLAAISSACGGESKPKNTGPTPDSTAEICLKQHLASIEAGKIESKSITEKKLEETIEFMRCSSIEPLQLFAEKIVQLNADGYLVLDNYATPTGVEPHDVASVSFYGGFPTPHESSYKMAINLNKDDMSYADFSIFLYKESLILDILNEQIRKAPNAATKIAARDVNRASIECLAWVNTIKNVGIPLKGKVEVDVIKTAIEKYEIHDSEDIVDCISASNLN